MTQKFIFFMDDFGTRTTCKGGTVAGSPAHELSFSLGGVIVAAGDVEALAAKVKRFCNRWEVPALHGNKIRSRKGKFRFLKSSDEKRIKFFEDLNELILDERLIAHGCVICRPGYRNRYLAKYPDGIRWAMSKTAFDIGVERAAKFAMAHNRVLDVVYERTGEKEDRLLETYFSDLKAHGLKFSDENSKKYSPLTSQNFSDHLNGIRGDGKANPLLQLADLIVHPISHVTSGAKNRAYQALVDQKMLLDFKHVDDAIGIKYSCYDGKFGRWQAP